MNASTVSSLHSVLDSATAQADRVTGLWWVFLGVATAVYVAVMVTLAMLVWRSQRARATGAAQVTDERRLGYWVGAAVALSTVLLIGLLLADFVTHHRLPTNRPDGALTVKITGHQWWWQIEYPDAEPSKQIITANELHLPVGRPVQFELRSMDVIHSFWVPSLYGKKDLIPGHPTSIWFQPEREGVFLGQCAEFCGYQHAHMGLVAVVESPAAFARWQDEQRQSTPPPVAENHRRGRDVFVTRSCVLCHTIAGTLARSTEGPPLSHFGSQQTFAAGSFPVTRDAVLAWVRDPQALKPGVRMPATPLSERELGDVVDYLLSLK